MGSSRSLLVLGEELRRRLLLNLLPRPLLILWVQSDLALVHCPSINRSSTEGETNKQTSGGGTCRGMDAGGSVELCSMWSLIHNVSEYVEELQRCIRDASEKCRVRYAGLYSDNGPTSKSSQNGCSTYPETPHFSLETRVRNFQMGTSGCAFLTLYRTSRVEDPV